MTITKNKHDISKKNIISVGAFKMLNTICEGLIKAYGAVFIYINSGQIWHVFLYFILYSFFQIYSNYLLSKLFSKHSKLALILRVFPFLLMYCMIFVSIPAIWFTILFSIGVGLVNSFYMAPIDRINGLLKLSEKTKTQSIIFGFEYAGQIIISLVSGYLLDNVDVRLVALVGIILYLITTIVFYFTYNEQETLNRNQTTDDNISNENTVVQHHESTNKKAKFNPFTTYYPWLTEALIGSLTALDVFWTVYVYINFNSFTIVGIMRAVIALGSLLGAILIEKISSKHNWKNTVLVSVVLFGLLWMVRPFATTNILFYGITIIIGFLTPIILIPLNTTYYKYHKNSKNRSKQLARKDGYRKLFALPLSVICMAVGSFSFGIVFMGGVFGLTAFQVKPASKLFIPTIKQLNKK